MQAKFSKFTASFNASRLAAMEYLGPQHFAMLFTLAALFHIFAYWGWTQLPGIHIIDIPVHAMNIRLGDSDVQQSQDDDENAPQPLVDNTAQMESVVTKLIRKPVSKMARKAAAAKPDKLTADRSVQQQSAAQVSDRSDSPRQFVRFNQPENTSNNDGSAIGNSTDETADTKARYEQMISLWIQKFKIYPDYAREQGMQGSTVVRISIDRHGNIRWSELQGNTGYPELDRAAIDMVRRANPVPAAPDDYKPDQQMFEFLIPVNYTL